MLCRELRAALSERDADIRESKSQIQHLMAVQAGLENERQRLQNECERLGAVLSGRELDIERLRRSKAKASTRRYSGLPWHRTCRFGLATDPYRRILSREALTRPTVLSSLEAVREPPLLASVLASNGPHSSARPDALSLKSTDKRSREPLWAPKSNSRLVVPRSSPRHAQQPAAVRFSIALTCPHRLWVIGSSRRAFRCMVRFSLHHAGGRPEEDQGYPQGRPQSQCS